MNDEGSKCAARTIDHGLRTFDQVQNVHTTLSMVCHWGSKPVTAGFDKLTFVHPGSFFPPAVPFSNGLNTVDQIVLNPLCIALPVNDLLTVVKMDRTRQSVQTQTPPSPTV
ncbi:Uncharacterised protein [Citrobacter amalonaticus]|nr:Uncharacterised protein [Citrobacter amalonaticus]